MLDWFGWLLLAAFALLSGYEWCARRIPPPWWYITQRKRLAMGLALRRATAAGQPVYWSRSRVVRADREKCFVMVQNGQPVGRTPESYRMYAVWSATGQIDDLGDWVFHWGIFPSDAIAKYEECRTAGRSWPDGFADGWRVEGKE